jgi:DNA-binding NtrC family response regulator
MKVLIADDDPVIRRALASVLHGMGHEVSQTSTAGETVETAAGGGFDLVLLDIGFPDSSDLGPLKSLRRRAPATDVIMVTAQTDDLGVVAEATALGAFDYVPKPVRDDDIRIRVTRVMQMRALRRAQARMSSELARGSEVDSIVGRSEAIRAIVEQARELAAYDTPVLITGETGTGKELVARALHFSGARRERPFVALNCAALAEGLTESELFGHERGAFTGAHQPRQGAFEEAEDGTLFLDEIGDTGTQAQAALLHVLENGEYRSVGGKTKQTRARVVLASNQDLEALIAEARFRKDLYYRINRLRIRIPPLRERREDVDALARHFLAGLEAKVGKGVAGISQEALAALRGYPWPGNVRELRNEIERAYLHAGGDGLGPLDLSPEVLVSREGDDGEETADPDSLETIHRLVDALRAGGGSLTRAGEILGVHRNTVRRWMKSCGIYGRAPVGQD